MTQPMAGPSPYLVRRPVVAALRPLRGASPTENRPIQSLGLGGGLPIVPAPDAGIKRLRAGSLRVTISKRHAASREPLEEPAMWPTWNTLPAGWTHVIRVLLVAAALCLSACTAHRQSISNPSGTPAEGEYAGPKDTGSGNGGGY